MTVIGVDPSSHGLHVVVGHHDIEPKFFVQKRIDFEVAGPYSPLKAHRAYDLLNEFVVHCRLTMPDTKNELEFFIEAPVVGRGGVKSTLVQAYVSGAVQAVCNQYGSVHLVNVGTWKKSVLGSGSLAKPDVKRRVRQIAGLPDGLDQDFYDATAICIYGLDAARRAKALAKQSELPGS